MSFPTQILPDHHRHCGNLFAAAEDFVQRGDWAAAASTFDYFHNQMKVHFEAGEGLLLRNGFDYRPKRRPGGTDEIRIQKV